VYAGGAELVVLMRQGLVEADCLVDIKRIPELATISWDGTRLHLGATVTHRRLETDGLIRSRLPLLADAESHVGNIRVRCQGTLGGNLCFADPHADPGTVLLVHDSDVVVGGTSGPRIFPLAEFFLGVYEVNIQSDEVLTELVVTPLESRAGASFHRIERLYRPTANVAAVVSLGERGRIRSARLAIGCVGPRPVRLPALESIVSGLPSADAQEAIEASGDYLYRELEPIGDLIGSADYKIHVAKVLLGRAVAEATFRAVPAPEAHEKEGVDET
jgi:carbon-monoxide dehydrogenase medium subunit